MNRVFDAKKHIYDAAQIVAKAEGYCINMKNSSERHMHLKCRCGGLPKNCHGLTETRGVKIIHLLSRPDPRRVDIGKLGL